MQPYSPHQEQSGAINPPMGDSPPSMIGPTAAAVDAANTAVAASMDASDRAPMDVPRQATPGMSGSAS